MISTVEDAFNEWVCIYAGESLPEKLDMSIKYHAFCKWCSTPLKLDCFLCNYYLRYNLIKKIEDVNRLWC